MAINTNSLCLVSAMDSLWYHQIILWSDPLSSHVPNFVDTTLPFTKFPSCPSSSPLRFSPLMDETIDLPSSSSSPSVSSDDISLVSQEDCHSNDENRNKQAGKKEDSTEERSNSVKFSVGRKLNKSISCKSLGELELEEVKGFMDLGFEFKSENLSSQMVKLLPGLQRLKTQIDKQNLVEEDDDDDDDQDEDEGNGNDDDKKRNTTRPHLSEAWTIKRSNSPLLNLRMPKVISTSDMKKHLKSWAKTVASKIQ